MFDFLFENCHPEVSFDFVKFSVPPLPGFLVDCFKVLAHYIPTSIDQILCHIGGEELKHLEGKASLRVRPSFIRFFQFFMHFFLDFISIRRVNILFFS